MRKLIDLTGQKFGRLTVIERAKSKGKATCWLCRCDCGNEKTVRGSHLINKKIFSCGCLNREKATTHGMSNRKIYKWWAAIKTRCFNVHSASYSNYGGRGITMFPAWVNDFQAFYDYVSNLPHFGENGYTLDRINNDGNYEPDNVRWATAKEQARNTRKNVYVNFQGEKVTLAEAAEKSGVPFITLWKRLERGETGEYLFRLPTKHK